MGNSISLAAKKRDTFGKKVKNLRDQGVIPGVVYGHGNANDHIQLDSKQFSKVYREAGSNTIVDLEVDGKVVKTIIYDVTFHPTSDAPRHVDFYRVKMNEKLTTTVPLSFIGESPAVRMHSAIVVHNKDELEITCLPADLPHEIEVDISKLVEIDDAIHLKDLAIPANVEVSEDIETVIAQAILPRAEVEATPETPAEGEAGAEGATPAEGGEAAATEESKE